MRIGITLMFVLFSSTAAVNAADQDALMTAECADQVTVSDVDFRGRPPFARKKETLCATDIARLELVTDSELACTETVRVRTVRMRGKPPYRRSVEELCVTEVASLELDPQADNDNHRERFTHRPPFNRH